ncbi:hypothetical protein AC249_AIPGENE11231 [Exaiptasia diaphana]|nr:hypothetical protein AC249_AIPGENE11231 [Exaiptasia diaphana]
MVWMDITAVVLKVPKYVILTGMDRIVLCTVNQLMVGTDITTVVLKEAKYVILTGMDRTVLCIVNQQMVWTDITTVALKEAKYVILTVLKEAKYVIPTGMEISARDFVNREMIVLAITFAIQQPVIRYVVPADVNVPSWSQKAKKWLVKTWKKPIGKIAVALIILCLIILVIVLVRRKRRKRPSPQKAVDGTNGFSNIDMPACLLLDAAYVGEMEEIEPAKKNRTQSHGPMPEPIFGASNPFFDDKTKFLHLDNYDVSNRVEREKTRSSSKSETKTRSISNPFYADESKYVKLNDNNESNL